jgi:uncharacterized protein YyaL (SSP411 family)
MLYSWQQLQGKPRQVVIAGPPGRRDTAELVDTAASLYDPGRLLLLADNGPNQKYLAAFLPFIEGMVPRDGKATAYVCQDFTCQLPVQDAATLRRLLQPGKEDMLPSEPLVLPGG